MERARRRGSSTIGSGTYADDEYPADPYPGVAPGFSFVHLDAASRRLEPSDHAAAGWTVDGDGLSGRDLDRWLADRGAAPMTARVPVLAFGSNRCPGKLTWLREHLGLGGPVVVLRARVEGLAAVWAAGLRARDGARPATLAVAPGAVETHAVWMATPDQVAVLDRCEGRGERYDLVRLRTAGDAAERSSTTDVRVVTEDGARLDGVWTYWAGDLGTRSRQGSTPIGELDPSESRAPLLVDGAPVPVAALDQAAARDLSGAPAPPTPDVVRVEHGAPDPASWPDRVFVYGTLLPGRSAWSLMAPHVTGEPREAWLPGRVHDTGRGYPALVRGGPGRARGAVLTLADPPGALPRLDAYEGPDYRRQRAVAHTADGPVPTWVWTWRGPVHGAPLTAPWPPTSGSGR
ncbi:gamma-glutamylcyclotransferase [Actinomycetospora lutea]|uniref:gamma-glutamylcyclotransferase family protein n=1 Tax=Actinomycetospora lutea TaxID=663604 RepID=UPI0023661AB8|nr:gamma-glutamylcyclotransferase family protein [Actinomycetospora lutea]MDD7942238.1 gamma-glutamylcyclotransferase [Actinomycetospora lutea]